MIKKMVICLCGQQIIVKIYMATSVHTAFIHLRKKRCPKDDKTLTGWLSPSGDTS